MEVKISVIIPVHNVVQFFDRCIKSVIGQTYKNLEIVLVDDGSTDGSGTLCDNWSTIDGRIITFHQDNKGVSEARNLGFLNSTGDAIIFIDADDELDSSMLETMVDKLYFGDFDVVCCGYVDVFLDKNTEFKPKEGMIDGKDFLMGIFHSDIFSSVWNKMFKRSALFDKNGNFIEYPTGIYIGEDFVWLVKVLQNCSRGYCLSQPLYYWIRREDSATGIKKNCRLDAKSITELVALDTVKNICKNVSDDLYYLACNKYFGQLAFNVKSKRHKEDDKLFNDVKRRLKELIKEYPVKSIKDRLKILKMSFYCYIK